MKVSEFFGSLANDLVVLDKKMLTAAVMDIFSGGLTTAQNNSLDDVIKGLQIEKVVNNIIENKDDIKLTQDDINKINATAENLKNGNTHTDLGCGIFNLNITVDEIDEIANKISTTNDPNEIVEDLDNLIKSKTGDKNDDAIVDGFFEKIILAIKTVLIMVITSSPEVKLIINTYKKYKDGEYSLDELEFLYENEDMIKCLALSMTEIIYEFLFNTIKKEIKKIVIPATKKIITEKINQFISQLLTLTYG